MAAFAGQFLVLQGVRFSWDGFRGRLLSEWGRRTVGRRGSVVEVRVLEQFLRLIWYRGAVRGAALWSQASQAWYSVRVGCARETVARVVSRLEGEGWLEKRRLPARGDGRWQALLLKPGWRVWRCLRVAASAAAATQAAAPVFKDRAACVREASQGEEVGAVDVKALFGELKAKLKAKEGFGRGSP
jgi:DNA-binding MarR family transcriptional regulator